MTITDYVTITVFAFLILAIGLSFSKTSGKDMKSFFAAGGAVPWWINSLSLFMGFVSAGTFVVWGAIAYSSGWVSITIQWTMSVAGFLVGMFIAPRWHKTKSLTAAEFISNRLGDNIQKTYSYLYLAIMVFMTGVYLYSVARILEVSAGIPLSVCILALGIMVIAYTTFGGLWAVVVTDVLQFVILSAAAIIVVPLSFERVGGVTEFINSIPEQGFLNLSNHEYTWSFLIGFGLYNFFYLSGQWGFVQRFTSVSKPRDAKKVGYLFGILYLIFPVIWMLPPMIYRSINPELIGLQDEGAYLMMCKDVLPAGMLGLILISLILASNSSLQGVLNISAGVITNDLFKHLYPNSSEKKLMIVAKLSNVFFGLVMIILALFIPLMGGAKEVVLSIAALTGGPMYMPIIWSLFSKRQNGSTTLGATIISFVITLSLKFLVPLISGFLLSRASEMVVGVAVPFLVITVFEIWLRLRKNSKTDYERFQAYQEEIIIQQANSKGQEVKEDNNGNNRGKQMIGLGIFATGLIMAVLGLLTKTGQVEVLSVSSILLLIGGLIYYKTTQKSLHDKIQKRT
ncbi:MAG: sodium:solute symporter family protein [Bacteroidota bacterium]